MPRTLRLALVHAGILAACLLPSGVARAQSQASTGLIRGIVTNASGEPVQGAGVILRQSQTNFTRSTITNERGVFVAALLPVGTYDITARFPGCRRQSHHMRCVVRDSNHVV